MGIIFKYRTVTYDFRSSDVEITLIMTATVGDFYYSALA